MFYSLGKWSVTDKIILLFNSTVKSKFFSFFFNRNKIKNIFCHKCCKIVTQIKGQLILTLYLSPVAHLDNISEKGS